jgi:hypothetical protein
MKISQILNSFVQMEIATTVVVGACGEVAADVGSSGTLIDISTLHIPPSPTVRS